jgi:murein DD-endopeptidase MepM/ murein hydrolase activator NlpD
MISGNLPKIFGYLRVGLQKGISGISSAVRVVLVFGYFAVQLIVSSLTSIKPLFVRRLFWGRSAVYRSALHTFVILITVAVLLFTFLGNFIAKAEAAAKPLDVNYGALANQDLLQQGGSITTVLALDSNPLTYFANRHTVQVGESVQSIADTYQISKDTLKWANPSIDYYSEGLSPGDVFNIPIMNGVLEKVQPGETLDALIARTNGNRFDVIELNRLVPPNYDLAGKDFIFVPNGSKAPPPLPIPQPNIIYYPGGGGYIAPAFTGEPLNGIYFDDPLSHPSCAGYIYMRGMYGWHDGVDIAKGGGCPIRSIADGVVAYAGWQNYGSGYTVVIDHGNGISSHYLHGDGNIWVQPGQAVAKGQDIMYMGTTGNSTGVHLHLTIKIFGEVIDPAPYVPYYR